MLDLRKPDTGLVRYPQLLTMFDIFNHVLYCHGRGPQADMLSATSSKCQYGQSVSNKRYSAAQSEDITNMIYISNINCVVISCPLYEFA